MRTAGRMGHGNGGHCARQVGENLFSDRRRLQFGAVVSAFFRLLPGITARRLFAAAIYRF